MIALGSDHGGFALKEIILDHLVSAGKKVKDHGVFTEDSIDYPDIAYSVVQSLQSGESSYGILICGTGIGMAIAANKHRGMRAALCSEPVSARLAREHNDANILTMGSRIIGYSLAIEIVDTFLEACFQGGRHKRRLDKISHLDLFR